MGSPKPHATSAERLLLANDNKLLHLYSTEEVLGAPRLPDSQTERGRENSYLIVTPH